MRRPHRFVRQHQSRNSIMKTKECSSRLYNNIPSFRTCKKELLSMLWKWQNCKATMTWSFTKTKGLQLQSLRTTILLLFLFSTPESNDRTPSSAPPSALQRADNESFISFRCAEAEMLLKVAE